MSDTPKGRRAIYMPGVCRECGCTEEKPCVLDDEEPPTTCYWVQPDLCDACATVEEIEAHEDALALAANPFGF
jgi:hypothetical protein